MPLELSHLKELSVDSWLRLGDLNLLIQLPCVGTVGVGCASGWWARTRQALCCRVGCPLSALRERAVQLGKIDYFFHKYLFIGN